MIRVKEAIVVEGKYDKIKLSSLVEGVIIETGALAFSRQGAAGLSAFLGSKAGADCSHRQRWSGVSHPGKALLLHPPERIKHAYIPDILGKERRKAAPSKEGKLGVEGMELSVLREALSGPAPRWRMLPRKTLRRLRL